MSSDERCMWGYQIHYRASAQCDAEGIFKLLDPNLKPKVFLVGISTFPDDGVIPPVCLEPADECGYYPENFHNVKELAKQLEVVDEERTLFHSHPVAQERHETYLKLKALKSAVHKAVKGEAAWKEVATFCTFPVEVNGFMICVVLELDKKVYETHYKLAKRTVHGRYAIAPSLLDATIAEFLKLCAKSLKEPEPGNSLNIIDKSSDEVIRTAGKVLMYTPAWAGNFRSSPYGLFEACNLISSHRYEGEEALGGLIIARENHPNVHMVIALEKPVYIKHHRAVRKLLEIADNEHYLVTDADYIYGIGRLKGHYNPSQEDLFVVEFKGHYFWELYHDRNIMMRVIYGQSSLPHPPLNQSKFFDDIRRLFSVIDDQIIEKLWLLVEEATRQKHGAMLIISEGAKDEADRLSQQSTPIKPMLMYPDLLNVATNIDGGVLIDPNGTCYAIGVILDGIATTKGDPARGSRYNSAVRYVATTKHPCLILVVSEDGMINFVPDLRPQIKHSMIVGKMKELEAMLSLELVEPKKFNKVMEWFKENAFYLSKVECDKINEYRETIYPKVDSQIRIVYPNFDPNPEMNETYFLLEEG